MMSQKPPAPRSDTLHGESAERGTAARRAAGQVAIATARAIAKHVAARAAETAVRKVSS